MNGFTVSSLLLLAAGLEGRALLPVTGLLGGFTTFSAFSIEDGGAVGTGARAGAAAYVAASVVPGPGACMAALWLCLR